MSIADFNSRLQTLHGFVQPILAVVADPILRYNLLWRSHETVLHAHSDLATQPDVVVAERLVEAAAKLVSACEQWSQAAQQPQAGSWREAKLEREVTLARQLPDLAAQLFGQLGFLRAAAERQGLDPERADSAAQDAVFAYLQAARDGIANPVEPDWKYIRTVVLGRKVKDEFRQIARKRRAEVQWDGSVDLESKSGEPIEDALEETAAERLPRFYAELTERVGKARPYLLKARRCCVEEFGLWSYVEEWKWLRSFVFGRATGERTHALVSVNGKSARIELQRKLNWFPDKRESARNVARFRVLKGLRRAWQEASEELGWEDRAAA